MKELWNKYLINYEVKNFFYNGTFKNNKPVYVIKNVYKKESWIVFYDDIKNDWCIEFPFDNSYTITDIYCEKTEIKHPFLPYYNHPFFTIYNNHISELLQFLTIKDIKESETKKLKLYKLCLKKYFCDDLVYLILTKFRKIEIK